MPSIPVVVAWPSPGAASSSSSSSSSTCSDTTADDRESLNLSDPQYGSGLDNTDPRLSHRHRGAYGLFQRFRRRREAAGPNETCADDDADRPVAGAIGTASAGRIEPNSRRGKFSGETTADDSRQGIPGECNVLLGDDEHGALGRDSPGGAACNPTIDSRGVRENVGSDGKESELFAAGDVSKAAGDVGTHREGWRVGEGMVVPEGGAHSAWEKLKASFEARIGLGIERYGGGGHGAGSGVRSREYVPEQGQKNGSPAEHALRDIKARGVGAVEDGGRELQERKEAVVDAVRWAWKVSI